MASQRNTSTARTPKIRQSCDTCQASKIRCGQERPCCRRCAKHSIECVYSASRRAGRPRSKRTADPTTPASLSPSQPQSPQQPQTLPPTPDEALPIEAGCEMPLALPLQETTASIPEAPLPDRGQDRDSEQRRNHDAASKSPQYDPGCNLEINNFAEDHCQAGNHYDLVSSNFDNDTTYHNGNSGNESNDNIPMMHNDQSNHFAPDVEMSQSTNMFGQLGSTHFPNFFFSENDLMHNHMNFDVHMTPLPDPVPAPAKTFAPAPLPSLQAPATATAKPQQSCECASTLLQHLGELSATDSGGGSGCSERAFFAGAVQRSRVLLDHCFTVLSCSSCSTRMSSTLVLCQAMEELSVALGMGTLWVEGSASCEQERCVLLRNLAKDEVRMRCGSYAVRAVDRQALLRTLMKNRLGEMQQAVSKLCQAVEMLSSASCRATCASIATELERRLSVKVDLFRVGSVAAQSTQ